MTRSDRAELREVSAAVLAVTAHLSVRDVLRTILSAAQRLVDARYAALGVPDKKGSFAEFLAIGLTDEQWRAIGPVPRRHGLLGDLLCDPEPVRLRDVSAHPHFSGWPSAHPPMTAFLGIPIVYGDEILGELFLADKCSPGGFTEDDEELAKLLAGHAAIAIVNARLYERSRELSIVEERQRIARELHDAVTQKLFSLRLTVEAAASLLPSDPSRAAEELATVKRLAADATDEMRGVVAGLMPTDLAGDGLDAALRKQIELLNRVHAARISITVDDGCPSPLPATDQPLPATADQPLPVLRADRQEAAYRIAQEALHNALRHATPAHIAVTLRSHGSSVELSIVDDGTGFDARAAEAAGRRLGLMSMRERARAVGGRLDVTSSASAGTTVSLVLPAGSLDD
jgi:signal transduction histidine kinase